MNMFSFSSLILSIYCFSLFVFILLFRKNKLHRLWALFNLAIAVWAAGAFWGSISSDQYFSAFIWRLAHAGGIFISVFFYHTVSALCNIKRRRVLIFAYSQGIFFTILNSFSKIFVPDVRFIFDNFYYAKASGFYFIPFFCWGLLAVLGIYELAIFYRSADFAQRNKIRYIFLGFVIGYLGGVTYFIPMFGIKVYPIASFALLLMTALITYALLKYRLLGIKIAITRAGIFLAIYALVLGIPIFIVSSFKSKLIGILGAEWWMIPMGLTVILSTQAPFLYLFFREKAEEEVLKEQKRSRETLKHASIGMTRIHDPEKLLSFIGHIITKSMRISRASIYLEDKFKRRYLLKFSRYQDPSMVPELSVGKVLLDALVHDYELLVYDEIKKVADTGLRKTDRKLEEFMRGLRAALIVPLSLEKKLLGFLVLGEKISGQPYSSEDLNVFNIVANQAALAIGNAIFYEETRKMQEQVSKAVKMSESIIETSFDGFAYIDLKGRMLDTNRAFCNLTGYKRDELLEMHIYDLDSQVCADSLSTVVESISFKGQDRFETRYRLKSGGLLDVEVSAHYMNEYGGRVLLFIRDITKQKKVEQSLRLAQLGELVAGIAHEIRNPLMIISGKAQLSLMGIESGDELKTGLGVIMEQCVRSSDIINRLLKFSKPSKGQTQMVNINESLEGLVKMIEHQYSVKNIMMVKSYAPGLLMAKIDEKEIQEVIMNLLHNAADAMADGGTITVATSRTPQEIRISVSDTGCGISRENMQKLFTPFFTTKDKGTGLGLSVCYGLIKAHKGELKCESRLGLGTTFTIVLPTDEEG